MPKRRSPSPSIVLRAAAHPSGRIAPGTAPTSVACGVMRFRGVYGEVRDERGRGQERRQRIDEERQLRYPRKCDAAAKKQRFKGSQPSDGSGRCSVRFIRRSYPRSMNWLRAPAPLPPGLCPPECAEQLGRQGLALRLMRGGSGQCVRTERNVSSGFARLT